MAKARDGAPETDAERVAEKGKKANGNGHKEKRLTAVEQSVRNTLMISRLAQGWEWPQIAQEAGLSITHAKRAVKQQRDAMPNLLDLDPVEIIEQMLEQLQSSVGDYERMAQEYARAHPSAAVGAKKGADAAREQIAALLQATGKLPKHLGSLEFLIEVRSVAVQIVASLDDFAELVREAKIPDKERKKILDGADQVVGVLETVSGNARLKEEDYAPPKRRPRRRKKK